MRRWSLRTKLVGAAALALLPILGLVVFLTRDEIADERDRRAAAASFALDVATSRYRQVMDSAQHLLVGACGSTDVRRSIEPAATSADLGRCETFLAGAVAPFAIEYSAAVVTDAEGVVRCSNVRSATGTRLSDREIFGAARDREGVWIGRAMASRLTSKTVIPLSTSLRDRGQFLGMCALGISLRSLAEALVSSAPPGTLVALVDESGAAVGGATEAALALPLSAQLAQSIAGRNPSFTGRSQNGGAYDYRFTRLGEIGLVAVAAVPLADGLRVAGRHWLPVGLALVCGIALLIAVWIAAGHFCVRPLRQLEQAAARIAQGEEARPDSLPRAGPELEAVSRGVEAMAAAIASREKELRDGLEQRDHMLREIHHRVKNNLQMISSLLNLQASEIRSPRIRRHFGDAQNRVLTLSILHRHLYERSSWSLVDFQQFISDLVRQISVGRPEPGRTAPRFQIRAPIMAVGPDTAIPVGLIVTEAVSNALNHDFDDVASPEIRIEAVEKADRHVELVIEDNGRRSGREAIGPGVKTGFGFTLLRGLAMQLGGEALILGAPSGGTRVVVTFPLLEEETAADA